MCASVTGDGKFRQDMPPPGGYKSIPFERIPAKRFIPLRAYVAINFLVTGGAYYLYRLNRTKVRRLFMERDGARFALEPMIYAERDRLYLAQLRKNRDEEERLMADVPGWEVGTFYGEPIYHTRPKDEWHDVIPAEFYVHCEPRYAWQITQFHKWN